MNSRTDRIDNYPRWATIGFVFGFIAGICKSARNSTFDNSDFFLLALSTNLPKIITLTSNYMRPEHTFFSNKEWATHATAFGFGFTAAMLLFPKPTPSNRPESRF